ANQFVLQRLEGEKYATILLLKLWPDGALEYLNCGHIPPMAVFEGASLLLPQANVPVGLLPNAEYTVGRHQLRPGERVLLLTDGVTEAANETKEMFGDQHLGQILAQGCTVKELAQAVHEFCLGMPLADDLTVLEVVYQPPAPLP
ncbi:MAG: PP2C family protein-serine/threonine phosphatase, partial [Terriglobales bacterium]